MADFVASKKDSETRIFHDCVAALAIAAMGLFTSLQAGNKFAEEMSDFAEEMSNG
jgi:hypothetical protein